MRASSRVGVIDYGICNIDSVIRAIEVCGATPVVIDDGHEFHGCDRIIVPGVGAFPDGMRNLRDRRLIEPLREQVIGRSVPTLGICLGMQLLASRGFEVAETEGLGWIAGEVRRLQPTATDPRVPHIGWNEVLVQRDSALLRGIASGRDFYFVHSYHFVCAAEDDVVAHTPYGAGFVSVVQRANVFGVQFHLEKSQRAGFDVLRNFLSL